MVKVNDKAPDFKAMALVDGEEKEIKLNDFKGKKVAIYFYPKDMTPGCTTQAENLRDNYKELQDKGIVVLGVSTDPMKSHQKFVEKKELPFILISDEDKEVVNKYGVYGEKKFMGKTYMGTNRQTFLIDEKGTIVNVIEKPKVGDHTNEILKGFEN